MSDWIAIEGNFLRKSAITAVLIDDDEKTNMVVVADGIKHVLRHHGVDALDRAKRSRDAIARAIWTDIPE